MRISQTAFDDIVREEVSSEALYRKRYMRPVWPGVQSGPTVGIGYDLGQTSAATIRADWRGRLPDPMVEHMVSCSGKKGARGRDWTARVKSLIIVPWEAALAVHRERVLPRWEALVAKALPNTDQLSGDSFGALVSLTYNRGASYSTAGARYAEMRAIKAHMASMNFAAIPVELRKMKRLWPNVAGLKKRRDKEAALFEHGLGKPKTHGRAGNLGTVRVNLNFRAEPNGTILKVLPAGTRIEINAESGAWMSVTEPGGKSGFVAGHYVNLD
jgi:hypothetical protein